MKKICLAGVASLSLLGIPTLADEVDPLADIYACANIADDSARLACFDSAVSATQTAQQAGEFRTLTRQDTERVQEDAFGFSLPSLPSFRLPSIGREANALADAVPSEAQTATSEAPAIPEQAPGSTSIGTAETVQQRPAPPASPALESERPQNVLRDDEGDIEAVTLQIARINRGAYDKLTIYFRNGQVWRQIDSEIVRLRSSNPPRTATIRRAALGSYLMQFDDRGRAIRVRREE